MGHELLSIVGAGEEIGDHGAVLRAQYLVDPMPGRAVSELGPPFPGHSYKDKQENMSSRRSIFDQPSKSQ